MAEDAKEEGLGNTERSFASYSDTVSQADNDGETDSSLYSDGVGKMAAMAETAAIQEVMADTVQVESNKKNAYILEFT